MRCFLSVSLWMLICGLSATALAGDYPTGHAVNALGRWAGYGWSRGYHSQDGCNNCLSNNPLATEERYFELRSAPAYQGPMQPAMPSPALKSLFPTRKPLAPKAEDARRQQPGSYPVRAERYPLNLISR